MIHDLDMTILWPSQKNPKMLKNSLWRLQAFRNPDVLTASKFRPKWRHRYFGCPPWFLFYSLQVFKEISVYHRTISLDDFLASETDKQEWHLALPSNSPTSLSLKHYCLVLDPFQLLWRQKRARQLDCDRAVFKGEGVRGVNSPPPPWNRA